MKLFTLEKGFQRKKELGKLLVPINWARSCFWGFLKVIILYSEHVMTMLSLACLSSTAVPELRSIQGWAVPSHCSTNGQEMFRKLPSTPMFHSSCTKTFLGML